jgi:hypothetical protein
MRDGLNNSIMGVPTVQMRGPLAERIETAWRAINDLIAMYRIG